MGSKGSQTSQTNQSQTYAPAGYGYVQNALNQATNAAQQPFQMPQAPVAGFSGLQQQGFGQISGAANAASPYYQQAAGLYQQSAQQPNISQYFNPMAGAVNAQLQNTFGQQQSQNTGQLTQAAGGVGADRIAVGQSQLANQQALAQGQVDANLYAQAQAAAAQQQGLQQSAASGLAGTGAGLQNAALQGGQSLLGAGGLQQQLQQAQLNSPYQQQLAQIAFPYQQAQFLAGITGALAPGLGGTTTGQGQTTSQFNPSLWGQIGGGLQALGGGLGYLGGSGKGSSPSYGGGNMFSGDAYGGSGSNPLPGLSASDYGPGYAPGGSVPDDEVIDIEPANIIPNGKIPNIQQHIPQLNLNPSQQSQQGGGGGGGGAAGLGTLLQLASMFGRGGAVASHPYADALSDMHSMHSRLGAQRLGMIAGGAIPLSKSAKDILAKSHPGYAGGGEVDDATRAAGLDKLRNAMNGAGSINPGNPYQMTDPAAVDDWRRSTPLPSAAGANNSAPMPQPRPSVDDDEPEDVTATSKLPAVASPSLAPQGAPADDSPSLLGFLRSPWSALSLGGLEAMKSGSLASGFGKTLQLAQAQREAEQKDTSLAQAAQEHQDSLTKMTPYQTAQIAVAKQKLAKDEGDTSVKDIVDGMERGDIPPTTVGLYGKGAAVRAEAARRHLNLEQMQLQDLTARKQVATLNGPQMSRLAGLSHTVDTTIDYVKGLAEQLHNSGVPVINRIKLATLMQTEGNSPKGTLATQYMTAVNTLKEEFANAANGGYAPTDAAWHLANQQINGDYGEQQLNASLDTIQRLIRMRVHSIPNFDTLGPSAPNRYTGNQGAAAAAAPQAGHTVVRQGVVNSGPNAGKRVIEYSDGTRVFQ